MRIFWDAEKFHETPFGGDGFISGVELGKEGVWKWGDEMLGEGKLGYAG
jgi:hypothetical protein